MFHLKVVLSLDGVRLRAVLRDGKGLDEVLELYSKLRSLYPGITADVVNHSHIN